MAFQPIVATRFALPFTILTGSATEIESVIAWPSVTVDYANQGSENEPPTRSYTGQIDYGDTNSTSLGRGVAILLPLSNENIFVQEPIEDVTDIVRVRWIIKYRRF